MTARIIQLPPPAPSDDDLEFERFMAYLDSLAVSAAAEYEGLPILATIGEPTEAPEIFYDMHHQAPTWPADHAAALLNAWQETKA